MRSEAKVSSGNGENLKASHPLQCDLFRRYSETIKDIQEERWITQQTRYQV